MENISHASLQPPVPGISSIRPPSLTVYMFTTHPATIMPKDEPRPLVIIMNRPWAELRMLTLVSWSTNNEPLILKKSKAIP